MSGTPVCQQCGAPWRPDLTGACHFCHAVAPPADAPSGITSGRGVVDADALARLLISQTADGRAPLDGLAAMLQQAAGDRVSSQSAGGRVHEVSVELDDWRYEARLVADDVEADAVHRVRGVVLKRQALAFDEWIAVVSAHLAEHATTHRHLYDALVTLGR